MIPSVSVAPDRVVIRGPRTAKVGQTLAFECATSNSNPASAVHWLIDGQPQPALHNRTEVSDEGGWVTISNISVTVGHTDKSKAITCVATNVALGTTEASPHIVTVLCKFKVTSRVE